MQEILGAITRTLDVVVQAPKVIWLPLFKCHILWRIWVYWRRFSRWLRSIWRKDSVWWNLIRALFLVIAGLVSLGLLNWIFIDEWRLTDLSELKLYLRDITKLAKGAWTFIALLVSAPVAFAVWWFRDSNHRQQLENQRKDTNLKDFQQLAQWASGLHFMDDESDDRKSKKSTSDITKPSSHSAAAQVSQYATNDKKSQRDSNLFSKGSSPSKERNITLNNFSKGTGANSLQIAAIYQLQAFICGDYGSYFQQPAFALLKSIWLGLMQKHVETWQVPSIGDINVSDYKRDVQSGKYKSWRSNIKSNVREPLMQAIASSLVYDGGAVLRKHKRELVGSVFLGLDASLSSRAIDLEGCNLSDSNWQCANLQSAYLEGANLSKAHMEGANMIMAHLEGADMRQSYLSGAKLGNAHLDGANLSEAYIEKVDMAGVSLFNTNMSHIHLKSSTISNAYLQKANMAEARLIGIDLKKSRLDKVDLSNAYLERVDFGYANLDGVIFVNTKVDNLTNFAKAQCNENTKVLVSNDDVSNLEAREAWKNRDYSKFSAEKSLDLRKRLRDKNGLVLSDEAYEKL